MKKTLVATTAAVAVTAGALTVPTAHAADPTTTAPAEAQSKPQEDDPSTLKIVGIVVGSLAFVAAAGGGACWAMQQGFIPNPAPNLIPCHPVSKPAPAPAPRPAPAAKTYPNCRAVWNDLGGPIRRGDAGYGSHLDRDGDGVGCEKRPK